MISCQKKGIIEKMIVKILIEVELERRRIEDLLTVKVNGSLGN